MSDGPGFDRVASFRDPAGSLFSMQGRIFRVVHPGGQRDLAAFLESCGKLVESGDVVGSRVLDRTECDKLLANPKVQALCSGGQDRMVVEHERIWFPSFPYEWPPEMLHAAGALTLELARRLLPKGLGLKDGTPYNILFRGPNPVFIDVLSFEVRDPGDATWLPYAQFVRTFVLPLLANKYFGLPIDQSLTMRRDGLEPEEVYRWLKPWQKPLPPFLTLISMPKWLASRHDQDDTAIYQKKASMDPEKARFILESLLNGLRRKLNRVAPQPGNASTWSNYMSTGNNYSGETFEAKQSFVQEAITQFAPKRVLDVGCNTGHFSAMAARSGAAVVAIDYDPVVAGDVWRKARAERLDILPLAVNLTRPSPGLGWLNQECPSFLDRARGAFDAVLMLAVIHHMLVTERIPLPDILELAAELTTGIVIVEFIAPEDSMFRRLVRGREALHQGLNSALFEKTCRRRFDIVCSRRLEGSSRSLYLLRKKEQ